MTTTNRPNILLITADQMRADCLSSASHPVVRTPHLDALAGRGIRYSNAYTPYPVCVPARLSLLTGQYPHAHGVLGNRAMLPTTTQTMVTKLRDSGYQTGAFGKMHFWPPHNSFGFERMDLAEQDGLGWKVDEYHSSYLLEKGLVDWWDYWDQHKQFRSQAPQEYWDTFGARGSDIPEEHYHTSWIADRTIDYINKSSDQPFFIWTSFIKPHHPFDPPKPWDTMYDPADIPPAASQQLALEKPLMTNGGKRDPRDAYFDMRGLSDAAYRRVAAHYYGTISHVDHHVGRIIAALEAAGQLENTLIVFTSDHADYMGDYGLILKSPNVPYDSLVRIPLIMAGPGCQTGLVSDALVSLVDVASTVLPTTGLSTPKWMQGRDMRQEPDVKRDAIFMETKQVKAVRTRRYKYLYHHALQIEELYDIENDPKELRNLAGEPSYSSVKQDLRERLLGWLIETEWERYESTWQLS